MWAIRCFLFLLSFSACFGAILEVGPGKRFARPCAAFAAAANGDDIEIDAAGDYTRDVCNITRNNLYIRGVNGRPVIDGAGTSAGDKGIWTIQGNDIIIDNIEFKNARSRDRNGAGIRHEGRNLRVRRCYFHDNEDGILATSNAESETIIEFSEFERNGSPNGLAHNVYVVTGARLIFRFNYSHRSITGHLLKTRLKENYILYNRLTQEDGNGSYECDIPDQGRTWLVGNVIQQGPASENQYMITYGTESRDRVPDSFLYAFHNTIVNETTDPRIVTERFLAAPGNQRFPIVFGNNIIFGRGDVSSSPSVVLLQNLITQDDPLFTDPSTFDYHLREGSPAIDIGTGEYPAEPGDIIKPAYEYVAPACGKPRRVDANPDFGAFEFDPLQAPPQECDLSSAGDPGLQLTLSTASILGGLSGTGRVTLARSAPAEGMAISLRSSAQELQLPQSVFIAGGAVSASFAFTTKPVATPAAVKISAEGDGVEASLQMLLTGIGVDTFRLEPTSVGGGSTTGLGRVILNANAPSGGLVVRLSSANPDVAQTPTQVTVPQGANQATFTIRTSRVDNDTDVVLTASSGTGDKTATLTVRPTGILNLQPASARIGGGAGVSVRINFTGPTPNVEDNVVQFESSVPSAIPAPDPLPVAAGVTFTTVSVQSRGVATATPVVLTAIYRGSRQSVTITLDPPQLATITSTLTTFGSGGTIRMTVSLNSPSPAPDPVPINLTSDFPQLLKLPPSVSISPGATSVSFDVQTEPVTVRTRVTAVAIQDGIGRTVVLNLDPMAITGLTCPTSAKGGSVITCRPTINGPAPVGGAVIDLTTSAPAIAGVPGNTTIPTGQTTTSFQFQTLRVSLNSTISVTGTFRGTTRSVNITLTP